MPLVIAVLVALIVSSTVLVIAHRSVEHATGDTAHSGLHRFLARRRERTSTTGLLLTVAICLVAGFIVAIGAILQMITDHEGFAQFDNSAARFGAEHATTTTTTILEQITRFGSTPVIAVVVAVVAVLQYRSHRRAAPALFLITTVVATVAATNVVKATVNRPRPDVARLVTAFGSSFPSGHSSAAAATYAAIALLYGRGRSRRTQAVLAVAAVVITLAVASSRVLLGVHWLTDVLAGMLLGWACFGLCTMAFGGRIMRFGEPIEATARDTGSNSAPSSRPSDGSYSPDRTVRIVTHEQAFPMPLRGSSDSRHPS